MRKAFLVILVALLVPLYLAAYVSIHEIGHTTLARFLGDPDSAYYLIKIDENSRSIGRTDYDISKLSWGANLLVSVGGMLATQIAAFVSLFLLRFRRADRSLGRAISIIAFLFAFDVPFQLMQALGYRGLHPTWSTGVDFMDFMLLLQMELGLRLALLKWILSALVGLYLAAFIWAYKRIRLVRKLLEPSMEVA